MEYRVLGPLEVRVNEHPLPLGGPKQRTLLAVLLLEANRVVSVDQLVDAIWGQRPPATATAQVQSQVSGLRRVLADAGAGTDVIVTRPPGYLIRVQPEKLDLKVFEQRCTEARAAMAHAQPQQAAAAFAAALRLWRGPALADVTGNVAETAATRLAEQRLAVLEERFEADLASGHHAELVAELTALVAEHRLRERLRALLMLSLYRCGRQAEALTVYRQTRQVLVEELGVDPSAELQRLEHAILTADPRLEPPSQLRANGVVPSVLPAQLPSDVADFTGRAKQVAQLRDLLVSDAGDDEVQAVVIATIAGPAGVGKTALAVHVAHQLRAHYPDGQLFVDLRGAEPDPLDAAEVLGGFLRALGVDATQLPDGVERRAGMYRSRLADRRVLVVLDNAAGDAQVRPLLPGVAGCAVLVTSRRRLVGLAGARLIELDVLDAEAAVELLARIAGPERTGAEPEAAEEVVRLCGYLPLAVRIAAGRLAARLHWRLSRMATLLTDEQRRLDELQLGDLQVRASVTLSYDGLDATTQRAFRCLGLLDTADFSSWAAAALLDVAVQAAEEVLDALVDGQLLEIAGQGCPGLTRYRWHDLVRLHAREQAHEQDCAAQRSTALARLVGACLTLIEQVNRAIFGASSWIAHGDTPRWRPSPEVIGELHADPVGWFETERTTLVAVVKRGAAADLGGIVWQLADSLVYYVHLRGEVHLPEQVDYWQDSHEAALAAARRVGDRRGEGALLIGLGLLKLFQQRYEQARGFMDQARAVFAELGDRHGEALVTFGFAIADALTGQLPRALQGFRTALTAFQEFADLPGQANADYSIGRVYLVQGHLDDARIHLDAAVQLYQQVGHRSGEAMVLDWLGRLHRKQQHLDEATSCFRQCQLIADELGEPIKRTRAMLGLAEIDTTQGRHHQAKSTFQQCLDLSRQLGDRSGEALALDGLDRLHHQ